MTHVHWFLAGTAFGILIFWPSVWAIQWLLFSEPSPKAEDTVQLGGTSSMSDDEWDKFLTSIRQQGGSDAGAIKEEERVHRNQR